MTMSNLNTNKLMPQYVTPAAGVSSTTGSPALDTSSRPGKSIYSWTGNGSVTIGTPGWVELLVVGGGTMGDTSSRGGGGGGVRYGSFYLNAGTYNVTVGASSGTLAGNPSSFGSVLTAGGGFVGAMGGGGGGSGATAASSAGGGAGGAASGTTPGDGIFSSITGTSIEYGKGGPTSGTPTANRGGGGGSGTSGAAGVVVMVIG